MTATTPPTSTISRVKAKLALRRHILTMSQDEAERVIAGLWPERDPTETYWEIFEVAQERDARMGES